MLSFIFHDKFGKLAVLSPNRKASFRKSQLCLQDKNISFLLSNFFYFFFTPVPELWEHSITSLGRKSISQALVHFMDGLCTST